MRKDPYQIRARELCAAAGIEPDSRVGEGRGQPAWCTFRDAARREHVAREQAEYGRSGKHHRTASATIPEQPAQGVRRARREHGRADAQLHVGRQRRRRRDLRRRPPRLCAAGRRRDRLRETDQHLRRRLRHRLRQHGGAAGYAVRRHPGPRRRRSSRTCRGSFRSASGAPTTSASSTSCSTMPTRGASPIARTIGRRPWHSSARSGRGNHYVDLMRDEDGFVWIGVHFGSRGLGHTSATHYLKAAGGKDGMNVPPAVVDEDSEIGRRYIAAMAACRPLFLRRPRMGDRARAQDHRRHRHRHGAQPPQLRLARDPRRPRLVGGAQGRDAGVPRPARFRRRLDGRRRGDPRRRGQRGGKGLALFDHPRRRPSVRAQGGQAALHARSRWTRGCRSAA